MRFLCLHGVGTNSHVLETQFSTISYEMERHHEFEFVEGTEVEPVAPEIKAFYPSRDTFYGYYRNEPASILKAIDQLHTYIGEEGPFEGVIGFSQGAALLSTYLIQWNNTWPERPFPVQCAIFFSASRPFDVPSLYAGQLQWVDVDACGALLSLPTAHIWGAKDETYKDQCELLSAMCAEEGREVYVHGEGHEIPGPRAKQDVQGCVRVIRRVIEKASLDV